MDPRRRDEAVSVAVTVGLFAVGNGLVDVVRAAVAGRP